LFIGTIEILSLIAQETNLNGGFWGYLQNFNINRAGFIIVGIFVATWIIALAIWHFGQIESKWELQAAEAQARADQGEG
jgi:high-affinity nickel-transport protein